MRGMMLYVGYPRLCQSSTYLSRKSIEVDQCSKFTMVAKQRPGSLDPSPLSASIQLVRIVEFLGTAYLSKCLRFAPSQATKATSGLSSVSLFGKLLE